MGADFAPAEGYELVLREHLPEGMSVGEEARRLAFGCRLVD